MSEGETLLTLVRHGETDWNRQRRIQGSTDIPLNETGETQARAAADGLAGTGYARVYSSPQERALETARIIALATGLAEPDVHYDLREREFGPAEGLTDREIAVRFPHGIPGQESREAVVDRALPVLGRLADRHPGDAILVVTHGAVISSIVRHLTGGTLPAPGETIFNLSLSHFRRTGDVLRLERFNVRAGDQDEAPSTQDTAGRTGDPSPAVSLRTSSNTAADPAQV